MSNIELGLWFAHVRRGSLDDDATDYRFAVLTAATLNAPHFVPRNKKPYSAEQFLPKRLTDERARDADVSAQIKAFFQPRMKKA